MTYYCRNCSIYSFNFLDVNMAYVQKKNAQAFCRLSLVRRNAAHSTHECEYFLLAVSASLLFFRLFFPSFTTHGVSLLLLLLVKFFLSDPLSSHIHFPLVSFLLSLLPPQQIVRIHVPTHTYTHIWSWQLPSQPIAVVATTKTTYNLLHFKYFCSKN